MSTNLSALPYNLEDTYILPFGTFYFYKSFVLSEIEEDITFNANMAEMVLEIINGHYGKKQSIGYISHRKNSYNADKKAWSLFINEESRFSGYATVLPNRNKVWSKFLQFKKGHFENGEFDTLLDAASWVTSLNLLVKNKKIKKFKYISPLKNIAHFL